MTSGLVHASITGHGCQSSCLETISGHIWGMKILCKVWKPDCPDMQVLSFSYFQLSSVPFSACLESYPLMRISSFPISSVSNIIIITKEIKITLVLVILYIHLLHIFSKLSYNAGYRVYLKIGVKHPLLMNSIS